MPKFASTGPIPLAWLDNVPMQRVHLHWTAGWHTPRPDELPHYHIVIGGDGQLYKGAGIRFNKKPLNRYGPYAAHTLAANDGAIGVSMACAVGAIESPYFAGKAAPTITQYRKMIEVVAQLCEHYDIPVTFKTVLSHAEVSKNLNIPQMGKWDFTRLPFMTERGALPIGNRIRSEVLAAMGQKAPKVAAIEQTMNDPKAEAVVPTGAGATGYLANMQADAMLRPSEATPDGFLSEITAKLTELTGYGMKGAAILLMAIAVASLLYTTGKYSLRWYRSRNRPVPNDVEAERGAGETDA